MSRFLKALLGLALLVLLFPYLLAGALYVLLLFE